MTILHDEFRKWADYVYERPLPAEQAKQIEAAYFAGASATHAALADSGLTRGKAEPAVAACLEEIAGDIQAHLRGLMS